MAENEQFYITIRIGGIPDFKLQIRRSEEEFYRNAVKSVNKYWTAWRDRYRDMPSEKVFGIIAVRMGALLLQAQQNNMNTVSTTAERMQQVQDMLKDFEGELDRILISVE